MIDVLILEDDPEACAALALWFQQHELEVRHAATIEAAKKAIDEQTPDLALIDINLPDGNGLEILELLVPSGGEVVVLSGQATIESAIDALRLGATDYLQKPADLTRLSAILKHVRRRLRLRAEVKGLRGQLKQLGRFGSMVGRSKPMLEVYDCIERIAPTDETVMITGPTGTGKEITSKTIHDLSRRREKPFVAVNCGAIAANLIESELFGHERGAFTGADKRRKGVFEQAAGGTLFLDEITEMPLDLQVNLLRVLETRQLTRVGGRDVIDIDVRIIAATNRDPHQAVADEKLRQDLLYRLLVFPIDLPALKDRDGDVPLLAESFLADVNADYETEKRFLPETLDQLDTHNWPGNVRELSNVVRRSHIMAPGVKIAPQHLPRPPFDVTSIHGKDPGTAPSDATSDPGGTPSVQISCGTSIADAEKSLIEATMQQLDGDKRKAAEVLGISLKTLYTRLQLYAAQDAD